MEGEGPDDAEDVQILLITTNPNSAEDRRGRPLLGESGQILRNEFEANDLTDRTHVTHLVKCATPKGRAPTAKEIKACKPYLDQEIERLQPEYVLTAGVPATKTLFRGKAKINQFHGEIIEPTEKADYTGMPLFDPGYTLRDPSKLPGLKEDINRLARLMDGGLRNDTVEWSVVRKGNFGKFIRQFEAAEEFAFDCETSGLFPFDPNGYITAVCIALPDHTWVIPGYLHPDFMQYSKSPFVHGHAFRGVMQLLAFIAHRDQKRVYGWNAKFDNKWLRAQFGCGFRLSFDGMLAHHVIDENLAHDLTSACRQYLDEPEYDIPLAEKQGKTKKPMRMYKYCAQDGAYTLRLGKIFEEMLRVEPELHRLFWKLTMPAARAMEDAEMEGMHFDAAERKEVGLELLSRRITLREELNDLVAEMTDWEGTVNWNSPQQIAKLLYEDLEIPCKIFTKKNAPSTSEQALLHIKDHPIVEKLLSFRAADKFFSTYIKGWEQYRVGNFYHFDYKLHGTVTGRFSSPLHPVPRDGIIRNLFDAPPGWTFVAMDLATAEMRIAAHLSKDPAMSEVFLRGEDIHWRTLMEVISVGSQGEFARKVVPTAQAVALTDPPGKMSYSDAIEVIRYAGAKACTAADGDWYEGRTRAKAVNFGFIYGMHEKKFIEQAEKDYGWKPTVDEAKSARKAYFSLYSHLEEWHRRTKKLARLNGYVRMLTGRLRRLPGIQAKDKMVRSEAERQAVNSGVQGVIGDYKTMVLVEIHQTFPRHKARLVGEHHDAVLAIVKNEHLDEVVPKMEAMAANPKLLKTFKIELSVPMEGEAELGNWGKGKRYERQADAA